MSWHYKALRQKHRSVEVEAVKGKEEENFNSNNNSLNNYSLYLSKVAFLAQ